MKAIILAAGVGSRLRPITNDKPKTLVKVNGKPILGYLLEGLIASGVDEVVVCVGYMAEKVINFCESTYPSITFHFIENQKFETTNNMYSLFLAKNHMNDDILLMNADIVVSKEIFSKILKTKTTVVAVDKGRYLEESMKIVVRKGLIDRISKKISQKDSYGTSIDIYKIMKKDLAEIKKEIEKIIVKENELNQWTEVLLNNLFISRKINAAPLDIEENKWYEIDNFEDLAMAEKNFNVKLNNLNSKKLFLIDRDGTLTLGKEKIKGADKFINQLQKKKKIFFVVTNNSSKTPSGHLSNFTKLGFKLSQKNILLSTQSSIDYFKKNNFKNIFWLANKSVSKFLVESNLKFEEKNPQAVLLTYDDELTYEKLVKITEFVKNGVPYFATHADLVCPVEGGVIPDIGTFIELVKQTTGKLPNKIFGKPYKSFIYPVLNKNKMDYKDVVIIGDRLYTDIKMAENSEITSVLVLSGETKREDYENSETRADILVESVEDLIDFI